MTTPKRPRTLAGRMAAACLLGAITLALAGCAATGPEPGKLRYYGGPKQPMYAQPYRDRTTSAQ
jgi:hypothetical protein